MQLTRLAGTSEVCGPVQDCCLFGRVDMRIDGYGHSAGPDAMQTWDTRNAN
jgi:hypothetical protein